jgi:hypothetical protein
MIMDALSRLRAAELNNMALGPGSQRVLNAITRAEAELHQQSRNAGRAKPLGVGPARPKS